MKMTNLEIVSSHFGEDLEWLKKSPYPVHVVGKQGGSEIDPTGFKSVEIIPNLGMEATSYLYHIVKNYERLPKAIAFIHGHEEATHQRPGLLERISEFSEYDFVDLNRTVNVHMIRCPKYVSTWERLLLKHLGPMPLYVNFRFGAQFVASREAIRSRPIEFYKELYKDLLDFCSEDQLKNKHSAMFLETFWHLIFGSESPIEDRSRSNLFASSDGNLLLVRENTDDYLDLFLDPNLEACGPHKFMTMLASEASIV